MLLDKSIYLISIIFMLLDKLITIIFMLLDKSIHLSKRIN